MFTELSNEIKDGIIIHLSNNPRLTQFLPVERIFGMQLPENPGYPNLRYGTPIITPYLASCWSGTTVRATLNLFAQGGPGLEPGETQIGLLQRLVVEAMNDLRLGAGLALIDNTYLGATPSQIDAEADRWRSILEFNVTAVLTAN